MAVGTGAVHPPPPIYPHARGQPVFKPPTLVEVWRNNEWVVSEAALTALADASDRSSLQGRYRLTFPAGPLVLIGRARGDPSQITLGGAALPLVWLGLDSAPPPSPPRGWHPWTARIAGGGPLELLTGPLKLSQLLARTGGA
ncbi:hypothetical protein [Deinococcus ruber]|uniref:Uncharacterized protein n=1 Tax=Deinococcus ruber TaxID=1848197 RepID=A0A918FF89_9DEIO|nr:hypothetical protein [Deinococcus ruber]GGR34171.1 hypothetical protein GCM10008957_50470 [Deinococcus ruber]